ncbi:MAG: hypothetical protein R3B84_09345 [Zavarzinella sp.]
MTLPSIISVRDEFATFIGPLGPLLDPYDKVRFFCKYVTTLLRTYRDDYFDLYHLQLPWKTVSDTQSEYYLEVLDYFHMSLRANHPEQYLHYLSLNPDHIIHSRINNIEDYYQQIQVKGIWTFVRNVGPEFMLTPSQFKQLFSNIDAEGWWIQ